MMERVAARIDRHGRWKLQLTVSCDADLAYRQLLEGASRIRGGTLVRGARVDGSFVIRTGRTWRTWGDEITVQIHVLESQSTQVSLHNRPKLRGTLTNWKKTRDDFQIILSLFMIVGERGIW